jgi:putative Mn2+ efflux pump MntP
MNFFLILPVAFALSMDAFAVSVGISVAQKGQRWDQRFRLALSFGFFQFMMPIIGWLAGQSFLDYIRDVDHWVAFSLLFLIGGKMVIDSFRDQRKMEKVPDDPSRGVRLIMLSVATSIDAFAVGLSFAALKIPILYPSVIIGIVAFLMTLLGTRIGPVIGQIAGKRAEFLGGLILILIGIKIIVERT